MSVIVSGLVWQHSQHKEGTLVVLLALADSANDNGVCWPSIRHLAAKARMSERGVQYAIAKLMDSGELELLKRGGRHQGANTYRVQTNVLKRRGWTGDVEELSQQITDLKTQDLRVDVPVNTQSVDVNTQSDACQYEPGVVPYVKNRHIEPSTTKNTAAPAGAYRVGGVAVKQELWELTEKVFEEFNQQTGRELRILTSGGQMSVAAKTIYQRIKTYPDLTFEDHQRIIANAISSQWWGSGKANPGHVFGPKVFEINISRKPGQEQRHRWEEPTIGRSPEQRNEERTRDLLHVLSTNAPPVNWSKYE
jgi:hypothetical protein